MRRLILAAILLAVAAPAAATPADDLASLMAEHYRWVVASNPTYASVLGERAHDDRLTDYSAAAADRQATEAEAFLARLDRIPDSGLFAAQRVDKGIVRSSLRRIVEGNRFGQRDLLIGAVGGYHQEITELAGQLSFTRRADYDNYLSRLAAYPVLNRDALARLATSVRNGIVQPCSAIGGFDASLARSIVTDPVQSPLYAPFAATRPDAIPAADWAALQQRARTLITGTVNPELQRELDFFRRDYLPHCARVDGVSAQPRGADYYAFLAREQTTTDLTPRQIHDIGLREVARIRADMERVAREAGAASREAYIQELRTNPRYFARTGDELMRETARVMLEINSHLPRLFGTLPRLPYTIREIPEATAPGSTTAYYFPGSQAAGTPGVYYVNTSKLDQRPLWEVPALSVHEAVPGHHLQLALQQEMDLSPFRRNFAFFTAFIEGWGLYSESLGDDMGLYNTPERRMGALSYQMWRAARLVVDTGLHAFGWDKARAVAYMRDNTALTDANIDAEVNRYIVNPGQALAYMIGRLKIVELKDRARQALGERFDIRRFHDAVLRNGAVPLEVLEAQIDEWIAAERAR